MTDKPALRSRIDALLAEYETDTTSTDDSTLAKSIRLQLTVLDTMNGEYDAIEKAHKNAQMAMLAGSPFDAQKLSDYFEEYAAMLKRIDRRSMERANRKKLPQEFK